MAAPSVISPGSRGVLGQIGSAPQFYALMAILLPATYATNAVGTVRVLLSARAFDGAGGVGTVAMSMSIAGVFVGFIAGRISDTRNPRTVLWASYGFLSLSFATMAWATVAGDIGKTQILILAMADGASYAMLSPALSKVQAACVRPDARGAAEVVNNIRSSVGGVIGAITVSLWGSATVTALACAVLTAGSSIAIAVLRTPAATLRRPRSRRGGMLDFFRLLRRAPGLRSVVYADVLLTLFFPTTLLTVTAADEGVIHLSPTLIATGVAGVLAGRLALARLGTRRHAQRNAGFALIVYAAMTFLGVYLLLDDWIWTSLVTLLPLVLITSASGAFVQGMISAKIQERAPDDMRGTVTGALYSVRGLLITLGILFTTYVVTATSVHYYLPLIGLLLLVAFAMTRGLRCLAPQAGESES